MGNPALKLVTPGHVFGPVPYRLPPKRVPDKKARKHLTEVEVELMMKAARDNNRQSHRDATMVLLAFRHGLRVSELVALEWDQVDFKRSCLHVNRRKGGTPATHPIIGDELRALRRLKREQDPPSKFIFTSEHGGPFAEGGFRTMVARLGKAAGFAFRVHPHMLRHAFGFKLANDGHDTRRLQQYLGHVSIQHTVKYTALSPEPFKKFWK
jgi:type 1 fimbriae regulatory protein FimB/type 1 fimbriae regulatory protein FimE